MAQDHAALTSKPNDVTPVSVPAGIDLRINGEQFHHSGDPAMPLLWYLRDVLQLDGTKYGGEHGEDGADLVLVNGKAASAIGLPMSKLDGKQVTTVEGMADAKGGLHPLQQAFIDEDAIGCGYCTPGWLIASMDLLNRIKDPGDNDIDTLPNLCRCGCQTRVRRAVKRAAAVMKQGTKA
ncbi:(2Fe-2S)-binding protein [Dyella choica]|uniref:(2Fe-2S)-binding protein n=1 Tax=Dyella choica TaxID=1927959 RepID=A0A3S0R4L1_9GAMM|nr:(2Fe-2S)-binding protein [Dyella choica]RUL76837.1 (2Fe-2S)-binding protein [Dyella choica]